MAEFGVQSTTLSAPQGAGTAPIKPAEGRVINDSPLQSLAGIGKALADSFTDYRKQAADERKQAAVKSYVDYETKLSEGLASGQIDAAKAAAMSRANFSKHAASFSEYLPELTQAATSLKANTEMGEAQQKLKDEAEQYKADKAQASQLGYMFIAGMSKDAEMDQIRAAKSQIKAQRELEERIKINGEKRAQGNYDEAVNAREMKDMSLRFIADIAGAEVDAYHSLGKTLGDNVRSGRMAPEEAASLLSEKQSKLSMTIQTIAATNPELAAPYRAIFDQMNGVYKQMIDPKAVTEGLEDQLKQITLKGKLIAMNDPKTAALVVANDLIPNNLALQGRAEGVRAFAILSATPFSQNGYLPQVVGNPEIESEYMGMLQEGIKDLNKGKKKDEQRTVEQLGNNVNNVLKQTSKLIDQGADAKQLTGMAKFFASPEYASVVQRGIIDPEAALAAKKTFQLLYEPTVSKGIMEKLNMPVQGIRNVGKGTRDEKYQSLTKPVSELIDIKFTGSGISFMPKPDVDATPSQRDSAFKSLDVTSKAVNQLIRIGAHMEGTTDYAKYWEDNRHVIMPGYFLKGLKEGDVRAGYKYKGGDASNPKNYVKVADGAGK